MPSNFKTLYQGQPGVAAALVYTVPAGWMAAIKQIRAVNPTTGVPAAFALYKGGNVAANMIQPLIPLNPGEFAEDDGTHLLAAGDTIYAMASVAATITLTISGMEYQ